MELQGCLHSLRYFVERSYVESVCRTYLAYVFANSHSKKLLLQLVCINRVVQKSEHTLNEKAHECVFSYALHLVSLLLMSALADIYIYIIYKNGLLMMMMMIKSVG
jgi:hypothetical protein